VFRTWISNSDRTLLDGFVRWRVMKVTPKGLNGSAGITTMDFDMESE